MKKYILLLAASCAAAACQSEIDITGAAPESNENELVVMTFSAGSEATKSQINGKEILWSDGDAITLFGNDLRPYHSNGLTEGGASASFTVALPAGSTDPYALYPADDNASINGSVVTTEIPAIQTVKSGCHVADGAMVAVAKSKDNKLAFKNAFSLLSINIDEDGIQEVTVTATGGEILAGTADITVADEPSVSMVSGTNIVTLKHEAGAFPQGTYYLAIAPNITLNKGLNIVLDKGNGSVIGYQQSSVSMTIARNDGSAAGNVSAFRTGFAIRCGADLKAWHDDDDAVRTNYNALLLADIDVNDAVGGSWTPVDFAHDFYGYGHKLYNLQITAGSESCVGFIGTLTGNISNVVFGSADGNQADGVSSISVSSGSTSLRVGIIGNAGPVVSAWNKVINFVPVTVAAAYTGTIYVGGVLGAMSDSGARPSLYRCENHANITVWNCKTGSSVGGLYGRSNKDVKIEGCSNTGAVKLSTTDALTNEPFIGGIVGYHSTPKMTNVVNEGNVTVAAIGGPLKVGGIAGMVSTSTLLNVENKGNVTSEGTSGLQYVGGLIGFGVKNVNIVIGQDESTRCINRGTVSISNNAASVSDQSCLGGIIAYTDYTSTEPSKVSLAYAENKGAVKMAGGFDAKTYYIGGIAGHSYAPSMTGCSNSGKISAEAPSAVAATINIGGIIGTQRSTTAAACTNTGEVYVTGISGSIRAGGITGHMANAVNAIQDDDAGNHSTNAGKVWTDYTGAETNTWVAFGGIVGFTDGGANHTIRNAVNSGEVYCQMGRNGGYTQAGGILGRANTFAEISGCTNKGPVTSDNQASANGNCYAGGIVGNTPSANTSYANPVSQCINEGTVTAISKTRTNTMLGAGGIIGWAYANISSCTNKGNINSKNNNYAGSICGIGRDNTLTNNTMYASGLLNGNIPGKPSDGKGLAANEKGIYGVSYSNTTTVSGTTYVE